MNTTEHNPDGIHNNQTQPKQSKPIKTNQTYFKLVKTHSIQAQSNQSQATNTIPNNQTQIKDNQHKQKHPKQSRAATCNQRRPLAF